MNRSGGALPGRARPEATPARDRNADVPPELSTLSVSSMSEVTRILSAIEQGDPHAAEQLLPLGYDEFVPI